MPNDECSLVIGCAEGSVRSPCCSITIFSVRKIILGLGISIDGYIARLDGTFDFLFMPKDFSMAEFFKSIDTGIMGRKTYDVAKAQGEGGFGPKIKTYVLSRTLP